MVMPLLPALLLAEGTASAIVAVVVVGVARNGRGLVVAPAPIAGRLETLLLPSGCTGARCEATWLSTQCFFSAVDSRRRSDVSQCSTKSQPAWACPSLRLPRMKRPCDEWGKKRMFVVGWCVGLSSVFPPRKSGLNTKLLGKTVEVISRSLVDFLHANHPDAPDGQLVVVEIEK